MKIQKILVIDDNEHYRKILKEILKEFFEIPVIITAENGIKGVEKFFEYEPDVVISDLNMPKQNGYITAKKISALSPSTPIIIISGDPVIHKEKLPPQTKIIKKPFSIQDLEDALVGI